MFILTGCKRFEGGPLADKYKANDKVSRISRLRKLIKKYEG